MIIHLEGFVPICNHTFEVTLKELLNDQEEVQWSHSSLSYHKDILNWRPGHLQDNRSWPNHDCNLTEFIHQNSENKWLIAYYFVPFLQVKLTWYYSIHDSGCLV